jgi:hypothetical protein
VVAIRVLHEVLSSGGRDALSETLHRIHDLLRPAGEFIVIDPTNPGRALISIQLSDELLTTLHEFSSKYKVRKIAFEVSEEGTVQISLQDFYDFITKLRTLKTEREAEEMYETHTPYTKQTIINLLTNSGFQVTAFKGLMSLRPFIEHYGIILEKGEALPDWYLALHAVKPAY